MWLYFDRTGRLLENLEHGSPARCGTTDFEIFAYFEGIDTTAFNTASLKLVKPDLTSSSYPLLLMNRTPQPKTFELMEGEHSTKFQNGTSYTGFYFNFASFTGDNNVAILLDTPGLWSAVISLYGGGNTINVQGMATFNVQDGIASDEGVEVSIDDLLANIDLELSKKSNISDVIISVSAIGDVNFSLYAEGQIFYDKTANKFYRRTAVSPFYEPFYLDYVSKSNGFYKIYGTDDSGLQITLTYGSSVQNDAIVQRTATGQILVPTDPSDNNDAASKAYVLSQISSSEADIDVELAKKVDKVSTGFKVYGTDELGAPTTYSIDELYDGAIVRRTSDNGYIYTNQNVPSNASPNIVASKKYVDAFGKSITASINTSNYQLTIALKDANGNTLGEPQVIDLPLESIVTSATYHDTYTYDGQTYTNVVVIELATTDVPLIIEVDSF